MDSAKKNNMKITSFFSKETRPENEQADPDSDAVIDLSNSTQAFSSSQFFCVEVNDPTGDREAQNIDSKLSKHSLAASSAKINEWKGFLCVCLRLDNSSSEWRWKTAKSEFRKKYRSIFSLTGILFTRGV
jgi:hypothetical protein